MGYLLKNGNLIGNEVVEVHFLYQDINFLFGTLHNKVIFC